MLTTWWPTSIFPKTGIISLNNTPKAISQALPEFQKALAIDPQFTAAHAYVGWSHAVAGVRWSKDCEADFRAAETALSLDDTSADAYGLQAFVALYRGEHECAEGLADKGATLNPNSADVHTTLTMVRTFMGKPEEALVATRHACQLSPRVSYTLLKLRRAYSHLGPYDEALESLHKVIAERPYWITARGQLIMTLVGLGLIETARR